MILPFQQQRPTLAWHSTVIQSARGMLLTVDKGLLDLIGVNQMSPDNSRKRRHI